MKIHFEYDKTFHQAKKDMKRRLGLNKKLRQLLELIRIPR